MPISHRVALRAGVLAVVAAATVLGGGEPSGAAPRPPAVVFVRVHPPETPSALYAVSAASRARRLALPAGATGPSWSPRRRLLAFAAGTDGDSDLFLARTGGGGLRRITSGRARDLAPTWSPDGARIAFVRAEGQGNRSSLWVIRADGTGARRLTGGGLDLQPSWSPDGRTIAFLRLDPRTYESGVWAIAPDGSRLHRLALGVPNASQPAWAPSGRSLLVSDGAALVVVSLGSRAKRTVVRLGRGPRGERVDPQPAWSSDGAWIAFTQPSPRHVGRTALWLVRSDGRGLRRMTLSPGIDTDAAFAE